MKEVYILTVESLVELARDFQADSAAGVISNDKVYIELWMKAHNIVKREGYEV